MKGINTFSIGKKYQQNTPIGEVVAEILERSAATVTFKKTVKDAVGNILFRIETADIQIKDVWNDDFSEVIGQKEAFIGWGASHPNEDGEYEEFFGYLFPENLKN